VGHTDPVGTKNYNVGLGRRRAQAVLRQLCTALEDQRRGITRWIRFQLASCGEDQPKSTPELSRRVEVFLPAPPPPTGCPPFADRLRLHLKILVQPTRFTIARMLESMRQVYEPVGFLVEVVSCEVLSLATLEELSIDCPDPAQRCHLMPCENTNLHPEHIALFRNRNSIEANELAVYFVRQTDPGLNGICDHPPGQPGVVVTSQASEWTLGHEIGHALGLSHVMDSNSLMIDPSLGGTNSITNPPPDLAASEVTTMTASALTLPC
jgi:hypothetical protein